MTPTPGAPKETISKLSLGWRVDSKFHPIYWTGSPAPAPGGQSEEHLVTMPADEIARHIVIVAQSGSGKSFFLGRFVEEILMKTQARMLVFDPNSDFRRIAQTTRAENWTSAGYDKAKARGFLPDEKSADVFSAGWNSIEKAVYVAGHDDDEAPNDLQHRNLEIDWVGIRTEVLSGDLGPIQENEIRRCHDFVRTISRLIERTKLPISGHVTDEAQRLFEETKGKTEEEILQFLQEQFSHAPDPPSRPKLGTRLRQAANHRFFATDAMGRFYFSNASEIKAAKLIRQSNVSRAREPDLPRLQVIDLPSIDQQRFRLWVVSTLLSNEWNRAVASWKKALNEPKQRVPTFIVVDEAHNLLPADPQTHSERGLRDQFRTIAAEGRKFGLFLILVTQRPDKLDPLVVSECENRVVMKLSSPAVLKKAAEVLGLEHHITALNPCLKFGVGRAFLAGAWTRQDKPVAIYGAARRTEEGGKNLDPKHWAKPAQSALSAVLTAPPPPAA